MAQMKLIVIILIFLALTLGLSLVQASDNVEEIYDAIQHENVEMARINLAADTNAATTCVKRNFHYFILQRNTVHPRA